MAAVRTAEMEMTICGNEFPYSYSFGRYTTCFGSYFHEM